MNSVASVKDRLKNKSIEMGKTMEELLVAYGLERTIYRLSISRYASNFTLKGGIFLYALFDGNYARATTDIDLLAHQISNGAEDLKHVFEEIFSLDADDPLRFDLKSMRASTITEFKKYPGVTISIFAYLDRTRIPVSIDIGFGDIVYPERVEIDFPVVLSDDRPHLFAYSVCSVVAEKFEAIVSLAYDNSRFKDYYDLYVLMHAYDFSGEELQKALKDTCANRHTELNEIVAFEPGFAEDTLRRSRWNAFVKKKKAQLPVTLEETILAIEAFMVPVTNAILEGAIFKKQWQHDAQKWTA